MSIPIAFPRGLHDVLIVGHSSSATIKLVCAINVKPKQIKPACIKVCTFSNILLLIFLLQ